MEILIVVALLGVLVAIVTVSVLGLLNRGGDKAYAVDIRNIQTAVSSFYADGQTGFNEVNHTWCDWNYVSISEALFPTYLGNREAHDLVLSRDPGQNDSNGNPLVVVFQDGTPATDTAISQHAIWMGLIVNKAGDYPASPGGVSGEPYYLRGKVAPLGGQHDLYINQIPKSASDLNGLTHSGGYTWIVGRLGRVYGVYTLDGKWYSGFSGAYP